MNYSEVAPNAFRALLALSQHVLKSGLETKLVDLVWLRASQINGCAYCIDMHHRDLLARGDTPERLALLSVWREEPSFTPRERAALALAEAATTLGPNGVPNDVYQTALETFGEQALVELTLSIAVINAWNRMSITFRKAPGHNKPAAR